MLSTFNGSEKKILMVQNCPQTTTVKLSTLRTKTAKRGTLLVTMLAESKKLLIQMAERGAKLIKANSIHMERTRKTPVPSTFPSLKMARLASTMIKYRSGNSKYRPTAPQLTTLTGTQFHQTPKVKLLR